MGYVDGLMIDTSKADGDAGDTIQIPSIVNDNQPFGEWARIQVEAGILWLPGSAWINGLAIRAQPK